MDENPHIQFDLLGIDKEHWKRTMRKNGEYCDELFLCQAARSLNRNIYVLPFFEEDWHFMFLYNISFLSRGKQTNLLKIHESHILAGKLYLFKITSALTALRHGLDITIQ